MTLTGGVGFVMTVNCGGGILCLQTTQKVNVILRHPKDLAVYPCINNCSCHVNHPSLSSLGGLGMTKKWGCHPMFVKRPPPGLHPEASQQPCEILSQT